MKNALLVVLVLVFSEPTFGQLGIYPGTLWCGAGNAATHDDQLGVFPGTDLCCRIHDSVSRRFSPYNFNVSISIIAVSLSHRLVLVELRAGELAAAQRHVVRLRRRVPHVSALRRHAKERRGRQVLLQSPPIAVLRVREPTRFDSSVRRACLVWPLSALRDQTKSLVEVSEAL